MKIDSAKERACRPKIGEHPLVASVRRKIVPLFMDADFERHFQVARAGWSRHPHFDEVELDCTRWALKMGLLVPAGVPAPDAVTCVARAVHDILLFPAYALHESKAEELALAGKFWIIVFHVDDEFDETRSAAIATAVSEIEAKDLPPVLRQAALVEVCRHFERLSRTEAAEFVAIFEGGDALSDTVVARALLDIRRELVQTLRTKHGISAGEAFSRLGHFRDALYRLMDVRISEIRQRVDTSLDITEEEYHSLRLYTIAMEPLIEMSFLFMEGGAHWAGLEKLRKTTAFEQLYDAVMLQVSYINDLVSFGKELREPNIHNALIQRIVRAVGRESIERLVSEHKRAIDSKRHTMARFELNRAVNDHLLCAIRDTVRRSNSLLEHVVTQAGLLDAENPSSEALAQCMSSWIVAHYLYCFEIERYAESIPFLFAVSSDRKMPLWNIADPKYHSPTASQR